MLLQYHYEYLYAIDVRSKGIIVRAESTNGSEPAKRLQQLHKSSAALRELLQKRAESQMTSTNGDIPVAVTQAPGPPPVARTTEVSARSMVKVTFWMKFHVDYGQHIVLVGSMPELGSWILADGISLTWSEGDLWNATVELPSTSVLEYKYVVVGQGGHAVSWQSGNNSVLAISDNEDEVEVHDNWGGNPGAKVVSGENLPVTREKKLLSWATDLENQVIQQRQELRKLRMELVTAQEEARLAREEAKRLRRALANAEAEKATSTKVIRNAEAVNNVLKDQIKDTTASFREALQAAVEILESDATKTKSKAKSSK
jgi:regulator of replication initiation timing